GCLMSGSSARVRIGFSSAAADGGVSVVWIVSSVSPRERRCASSLARSAFFSASSKRLMSAGFALRVRPAEDVVVGQHATQLAVVAVDACVAHYRGAQEDHQLGLLAEFALVLEYAAKDWNVAQAGHGVLLAFGRFLDQP